MLKKRKISMPAPEEDAAITVAALSDPDAQPLTGAELDQFKPMRVRGTKILTSVRLDPAVVAAFKATGPGWQTKMNDALREWAGAHGLLRD